LEHGVAEVGFITFSPATKVRFLLMRYVFDELGYRHHEWKCDHLNQRSINAAARLRFTYEGRFR